MNAVRFRYLHLTIFILNIAVVSNVILRMTIWNRDEGIGALFLQISFFLILFSCSVFFYTKSLIEFDKKFSTTGFSLLLLAISVFLVSLYFFESWIIIILLFSPILAALFFYVEFSIFFSFFSKRN